MQNRSQIVKNIFFYSSSAYIAQIIGLFSNIAVAKFLGPEDFGVWNIVMLVITYGTYTELGVISVMGRDVPIYLGQGNLNKVAEINSAARFTTIFTAILAAIGITIYTFFSILSPAVIIGLRASALILILQQIYTYHRIVLRSYSFFRELSQQQVLFAVLTAVPALVLVITNGLNGRLLAGIIAHLFIILYAIYRNPWVRVPAFKLRTTLSLMRIGIPIIISGFIITMLTTIDRLMIVTFLGEKELGYISLSIMLVSIISVIPQMASQVLQPRFNYLYGSSGRNVAALKTYVLAPSKVLSVMMPLIIGPMFLILPFVVNTFLGEYAPGIRAARIVTLGIYFYGILGLTDSFLITIGKLKMYSFFGLSAIVFNAGIDFILIKFGYGIEGVALGGTMITYFLYSFIVIAYAASHYIKKTSEWVSLYKKLWAPFIYMLLALLIVEKSIDYLFNATTFWSMLISTFLKVAVYLMLCFPLPFLAFKELNLKFSIEEIKRILTFK